MLPMAGEYTGGVVRDGVKAFVRKYQPDAIVGLPHRTLERRRRCGSRPP